MAPRARKQDLVDQAKSALEEKSEFPPEQADALDFTEFNNDNLLLAKGVTYKQFDKMVEDEEKKFTFKLLMQSGNVFGVEHLDIQRAFVISKLVSLFDSGDDRDVAVLRGCTIHFRTRNARVADLAIMPKHRDVEGPTVVFELGFCRTLPELLSYREEYFGAEKSEIQLYVAFKVYEPTKQMVAIVFTRDTRPVAVSFGLHPLDPSTVLALEPSRATITGVGFGGQECKQGIPEYQLNLPAAKVFHGSTVPIPRHLRRRYSIDLFEMRRWFLLLM